MSINLMHDLTMLIKNSYIIICYPRHFSSHELIHIGCQALKYTSSTCQGY